MTTYTWTDLRTHATERYAGQTPGPDLEQRIIDVFTNHPQIVAAAIDYIAERFHAGIVRSPWPVLATHVEQAVTAQDVQATDTTDRNKLVRAAEQWIRTAGMYTPTQDELLAALFDPIGWGDKGQTLSPWASDTDLRERMVALWYETRPIADQLEADQERRLAEWRQQHEPSAVTVPAPHAAAPDDLELPL